MASFVISLFRNYTRFEFWDVLLGQFVGFLMSPDWQSLSLHLKRRRSMGSIGQTLQNRQGVGLQLHIVRQGTRDFQSRIEKDVEGLNSRNHGVIVQNMKDDLYKSHEIKCTLMNKKKTL